MKKLLILLCCLVSVFSGVAQVNIDSFYRIGTTWTETSNSSYGQGINYDFGIRFTIDHDSVLNSISYRMLSARKLGATGTNGPFGSNSYFVDTTQVDYGVVGALRVVGKKVYFVNLDSGNHAAKEPYGTEVLLYDFDLHIGDSLSYKANAKTVISIDSIQLLNGTVLKKYNFIIDTTNVYSDYWYDGIGSGRGLLNRDNDYFKHFQYGPLTIYRSLCYNSGSYFWNDQPYMIDSLDESCYDTRILATLGVPTVKVDNSISVYPSPLLSSELSITAGSGIRQISICDAAGKKVFFANESGRPGMLAIALPNVQGLLFVTVVTNSGYRETKRVVKY